MLSLTTNLLQYAATIFPVLAPLSVERTAGALAFYAFVRSFAQTWGITIASTILQNELKKKLPGEFVSQFASGSEIAYAAIPIIGNIAEPLRTEVRTAFALSMSIVWKTMIGIAGAGIITLVFLKEVPMNTVTDQSYGLNAAQESRSSDEEQTMGTVTPPKQEEKREEVA